MRARINRNGTIQLGRGDSGNEELQELVNKYLGNLRSRKFKQSSIRRRQDNLRKFLLYLEACGIEHFKDVSLKTLEEYRLCLIEHEYGAYCIESDLRAVQLCFRYFEEQGYIFDNPAQRLKIKKAPVTLGVVLTEQETKRLLSIPDAGTPVGLRDRAILEVLYSTGIRCGEITNLKVYDIDLDHATVRITKSKTGKQRLLPLGKQAVKFIRLYLEQVRPRYLPKFAPAPDALWLCPRRKPLGHMAISSLMRKCRQLAGINKQVDIHTMRRTCATHMLRGGAHPVIVAELLGHATLKSLSHYLRTNINDLKYSHARSNPGQ